MVTLPEPESGTKRPKLTTPKYGAFAMVLSAEPGGWTATRKASWEICMRFADWLHLRVDLSEVHISRIWKFSKDEIIGL